MDDSICSCKRGKLEGQAMAYTDNEQKEFDMVWFIRLCRLLDKRKVYPSQRFIFTIPFSRRYCCMELDKQSPTLIQSCCYELPIFRCTQYLIGSLRPSFRLWSCIIWQPNNRQVSVQSHLIHFSIWKHSK